MISVEHLTKCYGGFTAVDDLSFEIEEGHVYGFLGPNGAGKSTTMNIMTGCLSATKGRVVIDGYDIFQEPYEAKKRIGYLPEQPPLYMNETPEEYLRFVGEAKGLRGPELDRQIEEVISQTKIEDVRRRSIAALSKGYKQRVGIARAIALDTKFVVLDESVSALDVSVQAQILQLLNELSAEKHLTYFFITHDLGVVKHFCDRILVMYLGNACELADSKALFHTPLHPYTESLLASVPRLKVGQEHSTESVLEGDVPSAMTPPSGCPFHTRCARCMDICSREKPLMKEREPGHFVACHLYDKEKGAPRS